LQRRGKANTRTQPVVAPYTYVSQSAPARDKLVTHFLVAEVDLQPISRAEPVVRPGLCALPLPANPAAQQLTLVGVPIEIPVVEVEAAVADCSSDWQIRVDPLGAKIEFRQARQPREIHSGSNCRTIKIGNGR